MNHCNTSDFCDSFKEHNSFAFGSMIDSKFLVKVLRKQSYTSFFIKLQLKTLLILIERTIVEFQRSYRKSEDIHSFCSGTSENFKFSLPMFCNSKNFSESGGTSHLFNIRSKPIVFLHIICTKY